MSKQNPETLCLLGCNRSGITESWAELRNFGGTCGAALVPIGEHVGEKLDCEPLQFFVRRDVYLQYACRACETNTAETVAPAILDRGIAALALLAQATIVKYVDHLPLYRQEAIHARAKPSATICSRTAPQRKPIRAWCSRTPATVAVR